MGLLSLPTLFQLRRADSRSALRGVEAWQAYTLPESKAAYLNGGLKRAIDICGAIVGLVFGLPLFGIAALFAAMVDHVPPIFHQERLGLGGRPFTMLKLRTLAIIETRDTVIVANMQRKPTYQTTRTGQFWRTHSIDEIIQFWLVLKGEMSLVGHRPIPMYYVPHLHEMDGLDSVHAVHYLKIVSGYKPGMTSLSSVNGRGNLKMLDKMEYDMLYAQNASLLTDLVILLRSVIAVVTCEGAK
jgi:lipopolysaccharide/colanic/teichoic acid biosynthesis glycosyltransferase